MQLETGFNLQVQEVEEVEEENKSRDSLFDWKKNKLNKGREKALLEL